MVEWPQLSILVIGKAKHTNGRNVNRTGGFSELDSLQTFNRHYLKGVSQFSAYRVNRGTEVEIISMHIAPTTGVLWVVMSQTRLVVMEFT